jgi:hypothetical protein
MKKVILFLAMACMFLFAGVTSVQAQPYHRRPHHGGGHHCRQRCDDSYRCHERCEHVRHRHHRHAECIRRCNDDRNNCYNNCR